MSAVTESLMVSHKTKVLISAFACNPQHGSEEAVGWGWVRALASLHDVQVITAGRFWLKDAGHASPPMLDGGS